MTTCFWFLNVGQECSFFCLKRRTHMASVEVIMTLPQAGMALVLDDADILSPTKVLGKFLVKQDDPRVVGHFDTMMGALIGEFAHQTATFLMLKKTDGFLPILTSSHIDLEGKVPAFPGDLLFCDARLDHQEGRSATFFARVYKEVGADTKEVATVSFSGLLASKRALLRKKLRAVV